MPEHSRSKRKQFSEWLAEVLELIAQGNTYKEAAAKLFISYEALHSRIKKIKKYYGAKSEAQACSLFEKEKERKKYVGLIAALIELSKRNQPVADLLKRFNVL